MKNTGRITQQLVPEACSILYGENSNNSIDNDLAISSEIDKAHILMLNKCGIIDFECANKLLNLIVKLQNSKFEDLRNKNIPRGIYMLYEDYLIEKLGANIGGMLQIGRSRNDLKITTLLLRIRKPYMILLKEMMNLQEVLIKKAKEYHDVIMPAYTHYQPAVPITYGHYLAGIAKAMERDINGIYKLKDILNFSPLGAGSVGGTSLPIDSQYTAMLLGFDKPLLNSVDAIASRDIILRLLSNISILSCTISRLSEDLLLWTSSDFNFLFLPDNLVGGSSMMPNKRNIFMLEDIKGRCSESLGAFVAATTAMHNSPFTNSISVGTEGVAYLWEPFKNISNTLILVKLLIDNAIPNTEIMRNRALDGFTLATEYANFLATHCKISFRSAHKLIGSFVKKAIDEKSSFADLIKNWIKDNNNDNIEIKDLEFDIDTIVKNSNYGGGPGLESIEKCIKDLVLKLEEKKDWEFKQISQWNKSKEMLEVEVNKIIGDVSI